MSMIGRKGTYPDQNLETSPKHSIRCFPIGLIFCEEKISEAPILFDSSREPPIALLACVILHQHNFSIVSLEDTVSFFKIALIAAEGASPSCGLKNSFTVAYFRSSSFSSIVKMALIPCRTPLLS